MGAEIPHWVNGREADANGANDWLNNPNQGLKAGWVPVSEAEAQSAANKGCPTVASWKNPGGIGHIGVIRPDSAAYDPVKGPKMAQAGGRNFNNGHVYDSFNRSTSRPQYFTYDPVLARVYMAGMAIGSAAAAA